MDQQKLRSLVFEKTGVKIDVDDPVFALVALNEAVLAEAVERHVALLDEATRELAGHAQALHDGGFTRIPADRGPAERSAAAPLNPAGPAQSAGHADKRVMAIAGGAALLAALLVLFGQAIFFRPAPPAAPAVLKARELSEEQAGMLRNAEKLTKIVQKLDAKTRDRIQAEMQKP
jgi:hypothetical protein